MNTEKFDKPLETSFRAIAVVFIVGAVVGFAIAVAMNMSSESSRSAQNIRLEPGDYIVLYEGDGEVPSSWILVEDFRDTREGAGGKLDIHIQAELFPFSEGSEQVSK